MRWPTPGYAAGAEAGKRLVFLAAMACAGAHAQKLTVPTGPPTEGTGRTFHDGRYGVRFQVPPGWNFTRKDREVSTFRLDARSAPPASEMRAVASLGFNPYPRSVLSGALVYFSVARHTNDGQCAAEATGPKPSSDDPSVEPEKIGGMDFLHGHDEHGYMCVEARDEVYTAYRKGSCYRFDLALNTFCSASSGALELSRQQIHNIEAQMAGILSTVSLDWEKTGPQPVPVPEIAPGTTLKSSPRHAIPAVPVEHKPTLGTGA